MSEDYGSPEGKYNDSPPNAPDTFESLHQKKHNLVAIKTLINPVPGPNDAIGKSKYFTATPAVVHFGGLVVGKTHEQVVNVVNTSPNAQRLYVYSPQDPAFKAEYLKSGSLAPGMSQKITLKFRPTEYKYYHDYLRIQTDGETILIPMHAYPVLNKLEFPRTLSFGFVPLCEPRKKIIQLACSIPVDFSYEIEVTQPHAYYSIEPLGGVIPANGTVDITITFTPITLGQCNLQMLLHVGQYGWEPMPCTLSAQAVSGLVEDKELRLAQKRLMDYITSAGQRINEQLGPHSSFAGSLTFQENANLTTSHVPTTGTISQGAKTLHGTKLLVAGHKRGQKDPVATLLSTTFGADDLNGAIDKVLQSNDHMGSKVLSRTSGLPRGTQREGDLLRESQEPLLVPKNTAPVVPRGPGAGNAFDAGAHYMTQLGAKIQTYKTQHGIKPTRNEVPHAPDHTTEGLRVPGNLDHFPAVNFVLTQEPGKLKPKDLKIAIEKSRAEREARAEEQELLRAQGGAAGQLDLRGILADERLNNTPGDAFKRQLRELAFLADVDDVAKQEQEKQFRVSEEFLGSNLLSPDEVKLVYVQRAQQAHYGKVSAWRAAQSFQHTQTYPMTHATVKAGAPATVASRVMATIVPSFDTNKNDVWGKRMNTLRRFISLVSRFIYRKRIVQRMKALQARWQQAGARTREEVRAFIEKENADAKMAGPQAPKDKKAEHSNAASSTEAVALSSVAAKFPSVANMLCAGPNDITESRALQEKILGDPKNRYEFTANMVRRVLFPRFVPEEEGSRVKLDEIAITEVPSFDDRTFFPLKVRPEYVSMGYTLQKTPNMPLCFPPARDKEERRGADEEKVMRPAADAGLTLAEMKSLLPDEILYPIPAHIKEQVLPLDGSVVDEMSIPLPPWAHAVPTWQCHEVDHFRIKSDVAQIYVSEPRRNETDDDWLLRPLSHQFLFDEDPSLRSQWLREGSFLAANVYLLGNVETRRVDPPPPPGPTLCDTYLISMDRHVSGLSSFSQDHLRGLDDVDPDVAPLQVAQDRLDDLTDSESDDEGAYAQKTPLPSLIRARQVVRSQEYIKEQAAAAAKAEQEALDADGAGSVATAAAGLGRRIVDVEHPNEQVELLRDRKILELESGLKKLRQARMTEIAKALEECSVRTVNRVSALTVQLPFHMYEDELLQSKALDKHPDIPAPQSSLHEEHQFSGHALDTLGSQGFLSPMKGH